MKGDLLCRGASELGVELTEREVERFRLLAAELLKWNRKINLTAIRGEDEVVVKHFLDSLTLLPYLPEEGTLLDVGSGAGFPALPVKIVRPGLDVVSVDAVEKKIIFQRHAARTLELSGFEALHCRVEELAATHPARFDLIVSRAFAELATFAGLVLPLLAPEGTIVAMKGKGGGEEAVQSRDQLASLGLLVVRVDELALPVSGDRRSFVILRRVPVPAPQQY